MKKIIILTVLLVIGTAYGETEKPSEPKQHKAHIHNQAKASLAFDGNKGKFELEAPAIDIIGFENKPKNKQQTAQEKNNLDKLRSNIENMILFETDLNCRITEDKIEIERTGTHAEVEADFNVQCDKNPKNSTVEFNIQKYFPKLKNIDVQILISDIQISTSVKKEGTKIELKNK